MPNPPLSSRTHHATPHRTQGQQPGNMMADMMDGLREVQADAERAGASIFEQFEYRQQRQERQQQQQQPRQQQQRQQSPASRWDALSTFSLTEVETKHLTECCICFEPFDIGLEVYDIPCYHVYHKECIEQWWLVEECCPVCRSDDTTGSGAHKRQRRMQQWDIERVSGLRSTRIADMTDADIRTRLAELRCTPPASADRQELVETLLMVDVNMGVRVQESLQQHAPSALAASMTNEELADRLRKFGGAASEADPRAELMRRLLEADEGMRAAVAPSASSSPSPAPTPTSVHEMSNTEIRARLKEFGVSLRAAADREDLEDALRTVDSSLGTRVSASPQPPAAEAEAEAASSPRRVIDFLSDEELRGRLRGQGGPTAGVGMSREDLVASVLAIDGVLASGVSGGGPGTPPPPQSQPPATSSRTPPPQQQQQQQPSSSASVVDMPDVELRRRLRTLGVSLPPSAGRAELEDALRTVDPSLGTRVGVGQTRRRVDFLSDEQILQRLRERSAQPFRARAVPREDLVEALLAVDEAYGEAAEPATATAAEAAGMSRVRCGASQRQLGDMGEDELRARLRSFSVTMPQAAGRQELVDALMLVDTGLGVRVAASPPPAETTGAPEAPAHQQAASSQQRRVAEEEEEDPVDNRIRGGDGGLMDADGVFARFLGVGQSNRGGQAPTPAAASPPLQAAEAEVEVEEGLEEVDEEHLRTLSLQDLRGFAEMYGVRIEPGVEKAELCAMIAEASRLSQVDVAEEAEAASHPSEPQQPQRQTEGPRQPRAEEMEVDGLEVVDEAHLRTLPLKDLRGFADMYGVRIEPGVEKAELCAMIAEASRLSQEPVEETAPAAGHQPQWEAPQQELPDDWMRGGDGPMDADGVFARFLGVDPSNRGGQASAAAASPPAPAPAEEVEDEGLDEAHLRTLPLKDLRGFAATYGVRIEPGVEKAELCAMIAEASRLSQEPVEEAASAPAAASRPPAHQPQWEAPDADWMRGGDGPMDADGVFARFLGVDPSSRGGQAPAPVEEEEEEEGLEVVDEAHLRTLPLKDLRGFAATYGVRIEPGVEKAELCAMIAEASRR